MKTETVKLSLRNYSPELAPYFEKLNKAWIEKYFTVEPLDEYVLTNPEEAILKGGGKILFAEYEGKIIGTVALIKEEDDVYELAKMGVDENHQGLGAGKFLCKSAIELARDLGAKKLILYTQSSLLPAISLYRKLGFLEVPLTKGLYKRADLKMELVL